MTAASRLLLPVALVAAGLVAGAVVAQPNLDPALRASGDPGMARSALLRAIREGKRAKYRAERLEEDTRRATQRAERTAAQAAAVAARIQETEARLDARLAERQEPLIRLSAALQRLSRRPAALGLLRPGSIREAAYLRALLSTMLPQVEARTAVLREELARIRELAWQQAGAAESFAREEVRLRQRQQRLAQIEAEQRLDMRRVAGIASRENERALALAERAGDLEDLVEVVGKQGRLRSELEALPGPIMRPLRPSQSQVVDVQAPSPAPHGLANYILPVAGRLVTGFGASTAGGRPSRGIVLFARGGAQVVQAAVGA